MKRLLLLVTRRICLFVHYICIQFLRAATPLAQWTTSMYLPDSSAVRRLHDYAAIHRGRWANQRA